MKKFCEDVFYMVLAVLSSFFIGLMLPAFKIKFYSKLMFAVLICAVVCTIAGIPLENYEKKENSEEEEW